VKQPKKKHETLQFFSWKSSIPSWEPYPDLFKYLIKVVFFCKDLNKGQVPTDWFSPEWDPIDQQSNRKSLITLAQLHNHNQRDIFFSKNSPLIQRSFWTKKKAPKSPNLEEKISNFLGTNLDWFEANWILGLD
jgi:hypothetical protein